MFMEKNLDLNGVVFSHMSSALRWSEQTCAGIPKKLFPWPLDLRGVRCTWGRFPLLHRSIQGMRRCCELSFTPITDEGKRPIYFAFGSGRSASKRQGFSFRGDAPEMQLHPGTLRSCATISLMSGGVSGFLHSAFLACITLTVTFSQQLPPRCVCHERTAAPCSLFLVVFSALCFSSFD